MNAIALQRSVRDMIAEYEAKDAALLDEIAAFKNAVTRLDVSTCVAGHYGGQIWGRGGTPYVHDTDLRKALLVSAWKAIYDRCEIDRIASADDKRKWAMTIANAASKAGEKFKGQKTWGAKFTGGIAIFDPIIDIGVPAVIKPETERGGVFIRAINAHANGDRKSGKRVTRYIPHVHSGWQATFDITVMDPDLASGPGRAQVERAVRDAGILVGIGQHRPENYGSNGRFEVISFKWAA